MGFGENFTASPNEFEFYLNLLHERIGGILIDVEGERFPITMELKDFSMPDFTFDHDSKPFTFKEICEIRDSMNSRGLRNS